MKAIADLLVPLVLGLLKWLVSEIPAKVEEGQGPGELEERLRDKMRKDGWVKR